MILCIEPIRYAPTFEFSASPNHVKAQRDKFAIRVTLGATYRCNKESPLCTALRARQECRQVSRWSVPSCNLQSGI